MVSLTSQRDFITSVFWPMGNLMGRWVPGLNFFNTGVAGMYRRDPKSDKLRGGQAAAHRSTVGHFKPLFSHEFEKLKNQKRSLEELYWDNRDARELDGFLVRGEKEVYRFSRPKGPYYNDTPYWIVPIPGTFIRSHHDQWNPNFVGLLAAMMSLTR